MYFFYLAVFVLYGLVIGSFLNVCVYRIPLHISVAKGRSFCDSCKHTLAPGDLVPVFSWLVLKGRCRYCHQPIDKRLPLVEAGNALLYGLIYWRYGLNWLTAVYCLIASVLLVMALIDHDTHNVYDGTLIALAVLAVPAVILDYRGWVQVVGGAAAMALPLLAIYLATHGNGLGSGDIWLAAIAGCFLGIGRIILAIAGGYIIAALCLIPKLRSRDVKMKTEVAMLPYLSGGIMVALLFGDALIRWYLSLIF